MTVVKDAHRIGTVWRSPLEGNVLMFFCFETSTVFRGGRGEGQVGLGCEEAILVGKMQTMSFTFCKL